MPNRADEAAGPCVERFAPSVGRWLGYFGMAFGVTAFLGAAFDNFPSQWQVMGIGVAIGCLSWIVLVRPSVALHEHGVVLRNMLRDTFIPASKIEAVKSSQTLMIRTEQQVYHGLGVSQSARAMMREQRGGQRSMTGLFGGMSGAFGSGGPASPTEPVHRFANEEQTGGTYQAYIESRIQQTAQAAPDDDREPIVVWSAPAAAALGASIILLALLFI
jgi:hypothetical protein